jgi:molybdenum cofactor synthesis domain-containing protein
MHSATPVDNIPMLTAAILVIGNEILSGRTKDQNIPYMGERLKNRGIKLKEVRIVPDDESAIIKAVHALRNAYTYVFTTGGIGATHDDITAEVMSKAFNQNYALNETAAKLLKDHYQERINDNRMRMAFMPEHAGLIDNPLSAAPGFFVENVYCMAGMPSVMQVMFDGLIEKLDSAKPIISKSVKCNLLEGDIAHALSAIQNKYDDVDIGSYPHYVNNAIGTSFVSQGQNIIAVENAMEDILKMIDEFNGIISEIN